MLALIALAYPLWQIGDYRRIILAVAALDLFVMSGAANPDIRRVAAAYLARIIWRSLRGISGSSLCASSVTDTPPVRRDWLSLPS